MSFTEIIGYAPLAAIAVTMVISWRSYLYDDPRAMKIMSFAWTLMFLSELSGYILAYYVKSNHFLYNIYLPLFFLLLGLAYYHQLKNQQLKQGIAIFGLLFFVFAIINSIWIQSIEHLQTLTILAGGAYIIFMVLAYFWELNTSEENTKLGRDPFFWFSFGILIYVGTHVPFLAMLNYLYEKFPEFTTNYLTYFLNSFSIVLNGFVITGFLCRRHFQKYPCS